MRKLRSRTSSVFVGRIIEVDNPQLFRMPVSFRVHEIKNGQARVDYADREDAGFGTWMPIESVDHFEFDLNGYVSPKVVASVDRPPIIDAIVDGDAEYLGKGDDGVVFRVGDYAVKMSTTVPYQPMNPGHRSPNDAADTLVRQAKLAQKLAQAGVPGVPPTEIIVVADKAFEVKPLYEIPKHLTRNQLDQIADTLGALHERGYVLGDADAFQVGTDDRGDVWFFDLGKLRKGKHAPTNPIYDDFETERRELRRLYAKNGVPFVPPMPILEYVWRDATRKRLWFLWLDVDPVYLEQLAEAAIAARIPNASTAVARALNAIAAAREKERSE